MEKKFRPNCRKLTKALVCPKGVPNIHPENLDTYKIFQLLSTHCSKSDIGLVNYNTIFINEISDLLEVDALKRKAVFVKLLFLVEGVNASIVEKQQAEQAKTSTKSKLEGLKKLKREEKVRTHPKTQK